MRILTFREALEQTAKMPHLVLGNGFSIACRPTIFTYESLLSRADFSAVPNALLLFKALNTNNFEFVIRHLQSAAKLLRVYGNGAETFAERAKKDAEELKKVLALAIATNHPDHPFEIGDAEYRKCRRFISNFANIYSLNYDILLYWACMRDDLDDLKLKRRDGFKSSEIDPDADYVAWESFHGADVHYLHGALHLFDGGDEIQKYTWKRTGIHLMQQIRNALTKDLFPLFVAEGSSSSKLESINHCAYLHKALRSLSEIGGSLFMFGHSLAENDDHVLRKILSSKVNRICISLFGDQNLPDNKAIIARAESLQARRGDRKPLEVVFYQAETANVWDGE